MVCYAMIHINDGFETRRPKIFKKTKKLKNAQLQIPDVMYRNSTADQQ